MYKEISIFCTCVTQQLLQLFLKQITQVKYEVSLDSNFKTESFRRFKNNCAKLVSSKTETKPYLVNLMHFKTVPKQQGEKGSKGIKMKMC